LNDGSDFTIEEAVQMVADKWVKDDTVELATKFVSTTLKDLSNYNTPRDEQKRRSPTSVATTLLESSLTEMVNRLSIDNEEWVAKVTNDRIYSVEAHPSEDKLIACAGDKWGDIGLWDVDASSEDNNGVNLFRVHSRAVCSLQWATSDTMISASYDGTVRRLDVETGKFQEIFATYDDSDTSYADDLGFGLDEGHQFWHQHVSLDHRYSGSSNPCLFLATSIGKALHLDLRIANKERVTFNEKLSDKKINTLR
jgi:WD40 repeat protein